MRSTKATNIVVFASGRGTDFQAIVDHVALGVLEGAAVKRLICNHPGSPVVGKARESGVDIFEIEGIVGRKFASEEERESARRDFDLRCLDSLRGESVDLVVLAGFDQLLSGDFVGHFAGRILNVHPAYDLRKYGGRNMVGLKVHRSVLANRESYSGCTVHIVTARADEGPPVVRQKVKVLPGDTPESLERRVLLWEHLLYPKAIQLFVDSRINFDFEKNTVLVDETSKNWRAEWYARQRNYVELYRVEMEEILQDFLKEGKN